eukprot:31323-Pelagococcus_subviridis.AAC.23
MRAVRDAVRVVDVKQVIVPARRELVPAGRPLQTAHLLRVARQRRRAVLANAHVVHHDVVIPGTRRELRAVPRERADARAVPAQRPHLFQPRRVPNLNLRAVGAHGDVLPVAAPGHRRDVIVLVVLVRLAQLLNVARLRVPQVHRAPERDRDLVRRAPVDEVEVIIVDQLRRVQNALGRVGHVPKVLLRLDAGRRVVRVDAPRRVLHARGGFRRLQRVVDGVGSGRRASAAGSLPRSVQFAQSRSGADATTLGEFESVSGATSVDGTSSSAFASVGRFRDDRGGATRARGDAPWT